MQNRPINQEILEQSRLIPDELLLLEVASRGEDKRLDWQYVDIHPKKDSLIVSNPLEIDTGDFLDSSTSQEKNKLSKLPIIFPFPLNLFVEEMVKSLLLLSDKIKGGYDSGVQQIKFMKQLIQHPVSDVARLFQEKIQEVYEIYDEIWRIPIKKRRVNRRRAKY